MISLNFGDLPNAENELKIVMTGLGENSTHPAFINLALMTYNGLGQLWTQRGEIKMAQKFFEKADNTATLFTASKLDAYSLQVFELFIL